MKPLLFDEIVFKDRNKDYGAYIMRKRYHRSLYLSLLLSLFFFLVAIIIAYAYNSNNDEDYYDFSNVVFEYSDLNYVPDEPPKSSENNMPPEKATPAKTENLNEIKLVNDSTQATDSSLVKDNTLAEGDSLNGKSNGGNGSDTGIVFIRVDEIPMFPGGDEARKKFLKDYFSKPEYSSIIKITGVVLVSFIVEKDGSLSSVKVMNSIGAACDNEVLNVMKKMPKWTPAKRNGLPVRCILRMPIRFEDVV